MKDAIQIALSKEKIRSVSIPFQTFVFLQSYDENTKEVEVYSLHLRKNTEYYGSVYVGVKPNEILNFSEICNLVEEVDGDKISLDELEIFKFHESGRVLFLD
jgi:hypothetical protein